MKRKVLLAVSLFLAFALVGMVANSATQDNGPVYSMEGAWYGIVSISGLAPIPSLDTFTSDAERHGVEGTFLCTIPAATKMRNPLNPNGWPDAWAAITPAGHGNWVRIDKNIYAFTAVRSVFDQTGGPVGWARFWGTITPISENEYTGTMNAQYYLANGTPFTPLFTGTMHSNRIEIEQ